MLRRQDYIDIIKDLVDELSLDDLMDVHDFIKGLNLEDIFERKLNIED